MQLCDLLQEPFVPPPTPTLPTYALVTKFDLIGRVMSQGNNCLIFSDITLAPGPSAHPFNIMV